MNSFFSLSFYPFNLFHICFLVLTYIVGLSAVVFSGNLIQLDLKIKERFHVDLVFLLIIILEILYIVGRVYRIYYYIKVGYQDFLTTDLPFFPCDFACISLFIYLFTKKKGILHAVFFWGIVNGVLALTFPDDIEPGFPFLITIFALLFYSLSFWMAICFLSTQKIVISFKKSLKIILLTMLTMTIICFIVNSLVSGANYMWLKANNAAPFLFLINIENNIIRIFVMYICFTIFCALSVLLGKLIMKSCANFNDGLNINEINKETLPQNETNE